MTKRNILMSTLPKINVRKYKLKLHSDNKEIYYRAFTVKEQKILLQAKEDADQNSMINAIKQIIEICTFGSVDPENLPIFDIENLFLHIRMKSVGDIINLKYKVKDDPEDKKGQVVDVQINLNDVEFVVPENHDKHVVLDEENKFGLMMKYPTFSMYDQNFDDYESIVACIDYAYQGDDVFYFKDISKEESNEWFESFDFSMLNEIKKFFDTMPTLTHKTKVKSKSGVEHEIELKGLKSFF